MRWTQAAQLTSAQACGRRSRVVLALSNENNAIRWLTPIIRSLTHLGFFAGLSNPFEGESTVTSGANASLNIAGFRRGVSHFFRPPRQSHDVPLYCRDHRCRPSCFQWAKTTSARTSRPSTILRCHSSARSKVSNPSDGCRPIR